MMRVNTRESPERWTKRLPQARLQTSPASLAEEKEALTGYFLAYDRSEAMRLLIQHDQAACLSRLSLAGKRVLELGCGVLPTLIAMKDQDVTYFGCDRSMDCIRLARRIAPGGHYFTCDAAAPGLVEGSFDLVIAKNLLHHLERPGDCLRAMRELVASGGRILVLEPNSRCVVGNCLKALGVLLGWSVETSPYGQLTVGELRSIVADSGLEVKEVFHTAFLAFPLSGDYGRMRLLPMSAPFWRFLIVLEKTASAALRRVRWLAPLLGFKVVFQLMPAGS